MSTFLLLKGVITRKLQVWHRLHSNVCGFVFKIAETVLKVLSSISTPVSVWWECPFILLVEEQKVESYQRHIKLKRNWQWHCPNDRRFKYKQQYLKHNIEKQRQSSTHRCKADDLRKYEMISRYFAQCGTSDIAHVTLNLEIIACTYFIAILSFYTYMRF